MEEIEEDNPRLALNKTENTSSYNLSQLQGSTLADRMSAAPPSGGEGSIKYRLDPFRWTL
jgi:hypothetical protein